MASPYATIRTMLLGVSTVSSSVGGRVHIGRKPPSGYLLSVGPLLLVGGRGGKWNYSKTIRIMDIQMIAYSRDEASAIDVLDVVERAINEKRVAGHYCIGTSEAYSLRDEEAGWPYAIAYYDIHVPITRTI